MTGVAKTPENHHYWTALEGLTASKRPPSPWKHSPHWIVTLTNLFVLSNSVITNTQDSKWDLMFTQQSEQSARLTWDEPKEKSLPLHA